MNSLNENSNSNDDQNTAFLNDVRAIATILVIVGHATIFQIRQMNALINYLWIILYLFHMAVFFMISGYLYQKNRPRYKKNGNMNFISNKFIHLMIPYYAYSVLTYFIVWIGLKIPIVRDVFNDNGFIQYDLKTILYQILTHENSLDVHVWFVFNLFLIFLIVTILYDLLSRRYAILTVLLLYIIITCVVDLLEIIRSSFSELIYFMIGMELAKCTERERMMGLMKIKKSIPIIIPLTCGAIFVCVLNQSGLVVFNQISIYGKILNKICHYISGTVLGLGFISMVHFWSKEHSSKLLKLINDYSYDIYLIHQPFIVTGIVFLILKITDNSILAVMIATIAGITISIAISRLFLRKNNILSFVFLGKKIHRRMDE